MAQPTLVSQSRRNASERPAVIDLGEPVDMTEEQRSWLVADTSGANRPVAERLRETLCGLPEPDRKVFELYFLHGLTAEVVAARLGLPVGEVLSVAGCVVDRVRGALAPG